jgi:hypothetical protein
LFTNPLLLKHMDLPLPHQYPGATQERLESINFIAYKGELYKGLFIYSSHFALRAASSPEA